MHVRTTVTPLLAAAVAVAIVGCGGGATTVTTAAKPVEPTAAQIREKAAAEAAAHKEQVARKKEEAKEATEQKKQEAHEQREQQAQQPAESTNAGASGSGGGQTVPSDVVNKSLPDAEAELNNMGIPFTTNSYGHIVILHGDWGVCSTTPPPGQPVGGTLVLNLGHFSCGA